MEMSNQTLGFLGCGKISSAMATGFSTATVIPSQIFVTKRSVEKSTALKERFPDVITVCDENATVVSSSAVVFIGLLPGVAREQLPLLNFTGKTVISTMAAVDYSELVTMVSAHGTPISVTKIVPLPSSAHHVGPILSYSPPETCNAAEVATLLKFIGTPVSTRLESEMKPLISITGHISSFYELMKVTQDWTVSHGVASDTSRDFVTAFYTSLGQYAHSTTHPLGDMAEEAATPGGLNAQSLAYLKTETPHYQSQEQSLEHVWRRLAGLPAVSDATLASNK